MDAASLRVPLRRLVRHGPGAAVTNYPAAFHVAHLAEDLKALEYGTFPQLQRAILDFEAFDELSD